MKSFGDVLCHAPFCGHDKFVFRRVEFPQITHMVTAAIRSCICLEMNLIKPINEKDS